MSTVPSLTVAELESESAELLPNRETLSLHGSRTVNWSGGFLSNNNVAGLVGQQQAGAGNHQFGFVWVV